MTQLFPLDNRTWLRSTDLPGLNPTSSLWSNDLVGNLLDDAFLLVNVLTHRGSVFHGVAHFFGDRLTFFFVLDNFEFVMDRFADWKV